MGRDEIHLPKGYTWKSFTEFLLSTLPEHTRNRYRKKLETSIRFWKNKGGVLSDEVIQKLRERNIPIQVGESTNYKTDKKPVRILILQSSRKFRLTKECVSVSYAMITFANIWDSH